MQAYFDRDDAHLEADALLSHSASDRDSGDDVADFGRRRYLNLAAFSAGLGLLAFLLVIQLTSVEPAFSFQQPDKDKPDMRFVIEIPKPEQQQPKPKPKPKIEKPKPEPVERLRAVPDRTMHVIRPTEKLQDRREVKDKERDVEQDVAKNRIQEKIHDRNEVRDSERDVKKESTTKRTLPAVRTPKIVTKEEAVQRDVSQEAVRQTTVSGLAETTGDFVEDIAPRSGVSNLSSEGEGLSRINLDPYTYQMVNVCLRLCATSMFTHSGMDEAEASSSAQWLKVNRGAGHSSFSYRYNRQWVEVTVNVKSLTDISNLSFVSIPSNLSKGGQADEFLKEVTRKLCSLLGYDDCVKRL